MVAVNEAEMHFEAYLESRVIEFEYENDAGDRRPDYWLSPLRGGAVCEVRHVTAAMSDLPDGSGPFDPYKPLAKAVKRKSAQGRGLEGKRPYVVVLWAPHWVDDPLSVLGALFGKAGVVMRISRATGEADLSQLSLGFGLNATLQAGQRQHISAVAMLRRFNPGLRAAQDEVEELLPPGGSPEEGLKTILDVYGRRGDEGLLDDGARCPRIVTFHNTHASVPLPLAVFDGSYDEQYRVTDSGYVRVFAGHEVDRLPR
jgi:hypothetical protein